MQPLNIFVHSILRITHFKKKTLAIDESNRSDINALKRYRFFMLLANPDVKCFWTFMSFMFTVNFDITEFIVCSTKFGWIYFSSNSKFEEVIWIHFQRMQYLFVGSMKRWKKNQKQNFVRAKEWIKYVISIKVQRKLGHKKSSIVCILNQVEWVMFKTYTFD